MSPEKRLQNLARTKREIVKGNDNSLSATAVALTVFHICVRGSQHGEEYPLTYYVITSEFYPRSNLEVET